MSVQDPATDVSAYRHGRVPRDLRLRQVLALAGELFAERGYTGTSMDELARRAGVSKPVVYDLVGSKEELFRTLMLRTADELAERVADAVRSEDDPFERLRAGATAWFRFVAEHRATWAAFLAGEDLPMGVEVRAIRRRQAQLVATLLAESAGDLGVAVVPSLIDAAAHMLNGGFEALGAWSADHTDVSPEQLADLCARAIYPGLIALLSDPTVWGS